MSSPRPASKWSEVAPSSGVFILSYPVPQIGSANSVAIRTSRGIWLVSPPAEAQEVHLDFLAAEGPLRGLIAPNSYHSLGLAEWRKAFPDLPAFAPRRALERLKRHGQNGLLALEEVGPEEGVRFLNHPGVSRGNTMIVIDRGPRKIVYADEILINLQKLPDSLLAKLFFRLLRTGPGLKVNWPYLLGFVSDRKSLARDLDREIDERSLVIPSHGRIIESPEEVHVAKSLLRGIHHFGRPEGNRAIVPTPRKV